MSDDEYESAASRCSNPDTRLILYRINKLEETVKEHIKANQAAHAAIWKGIRSLENWRTWVLGAMAVLSGIAWWMHK